MIAAHNALTNARIQIRVVTHRASIAIGWEIIVKLTFLGSTSQTGNCPTLFATDHDTYVIQGWRITDPEAVAAMDIPDHETAVEVPRALLGFAPPANPA